MSLSFTKLNNTYSPDPNGARPLINIYEKIVSIRFDLDSINYKQFTREQLGEITFTDCLMFRVGSPNDEGFFIDPKNPSKRNNSRWNYTDFPNLNFHNFYCVENSDWKTTFGPHAFLNKELTEKGHTDADFKHFLFLMKDGTFECIARSYTETIPA